MGIFSRAILSGLWLALVSLGSISVRAQDSVYTHWPTVQLTPYDTAKRYTLHQQLEVLLSKPIRLVGGAKALAEGDTPGWVALKVARQYTAALNFNAATRSAEQALEMARKAGDRRLEMATLATIGNISREVFLGSSLKAVPYHEEALEIAQALRDTANIVSQLISLADNYLQAGRNDRFLEYTERVTRILTQFDLPTAHLSLGVLFGCFLETQNEVAAAEHFFRSTIPVAKALGNIGYVQHLHLQLFSLYLMARDVKKAGIALDSVRAIGPKLAEDELYESLYQLEKMRGNQNEAFRMLEKAYRSLGNRYTQRNAEQLAGWETQLRTQEKELQLKEQKRQRWRWIGLALALAGLFVGSVFAFLQQRKIRNKLAAQNALIERQSAELRRLDEAKSRFFANVSHELRTPITLMLGPVGSMLKGETLSARDAALATTAQQHGRQLLRLVNEILDLSKMEAGKMKLQETTVSLQPFLRRVVGAFESHAERLGIRFLFEYRVAERLRVLLDEDKLQKVVNNLLANALKFTPPNSGGTVSVRVEEVNNHIRLSIQDTGRGIHPDDLPHVFERFYQTNQLDAPVEGGTGIGLALCREFADVMDGKIWADSKLGEGSTFYFEFPKKEVLGVGETADFQGETFADAGPQMEAWAMPGAVGDFSGVSGKGKPTILLVEDNDSLRDYVKMILSTQYHVETAGHGQAALDILAARSSVQLIISDVMMPVMDGFQLIEKIKTDDRYRHLPVVMLTARADLRDKLKALRIGVDDYLLKPFEEEELLARVENLLKHAGKRFLVEVDGPRMDNTHEPAPAPQPEGLSAEDLAWLAELEKTVERAINDAHFSADTLADAMFTSRTKFFQRVKRLTGMTPNDYVLEVRFNKARHLLESRATASVKAAAGSVGFRDVEYFSKQFRTRFGKAPSEYLG